MSTSPQVGTHLGTDSHRCSYAGGQLVTSVPVAAFPQVTGRRPGPSLHTRWTTLGVQRHVDLWTKRPAVHSIHSPGTTKAPVPGGGRGPRKRLERPSCRVPPRACEGWGVGGPFLSASAST